MALAALSLLSLLAFSDASLLLRNDGRIVNGEDAKLGEIPYQVSLQDKFSSFHFCGGSVLNENYVITAAHCVSSKRPANLKVVVGLIDLTKPKLQHDVVKIITHEKYSARDSWINDIALLKVKQPFVQSENVAFVPLPAPNEVINANDVAVVSGWGRLWLGGPTTVHLQRVNIYVADQDYCRYMYEGVAQNIYDSHICAFDSTTEKGSCNGDSGGPLTVNGKLVGLVSWAMGCAHTDYPTVFTRVTSHLKWIKENSV